ncbi:MAG: hypothetical protein PUP91_08725 [Rhizonema sp. PD37]|nr:hypothetical protein [Rhizonema sp. PD37]
MNKIAFALLCSSSFFAFIVQTANPALANKVSAENLAYPQAKPIANQQVNAPVTKNPEVPSVRSNEKAKELAVQMFGCDCPSCQARASQVLLQGNLPQPN